MLLQPRPDVDRRPMQADFLRTALTDLDPINRLLQRLRNNHLQHLSQVRHLLGLRGQLRHLLFRLNVRQHRLQMQ